MMHTSNVTDGYDRYRNNHLAAAVYLPNSATFETKYLFDIKTAMKIDKSDQYVLD